MTNIAKVVGFHKIGESNIRKLLGLHTHTHTQELAKVDLLKINEEEINKDTDMISMIKKKELFDLKKIQI